ncbi:MAG TPA: sulfatase-like hydrolase/transferase, partial [Leptolinea sp.]
CSIYSNPHILTGVPSTHEFDNRLTNRWPTLFQYARAMGYKTQYLDAQENYLWNGLLAKDLDFVDVHLTVDDFSRTIYADKNAASYIHDQVTQSTGNFIVLNKMGMHVLYENNYPPEEAIWLPTPVGFDYKISSRVINAYDNAVHFNLESFFQTLMPGMEEIPNTFLIYTSDHGDTLQEKGETWSHCHNTSPESKVPLFIIGHLNTMPDTQYEASHSNIMATILDLMNVPQENRLHPYALSLLKSTHVSNSQRFYLDGNLNPVPYHSN